MGSVYGGVPNRRLQIGEIRPPAAIDGARIWSKVSLYPARMAETR